MNCYERYAIRFDESVRSKNNHDRTDSLLHVNNYKMHSADKTVISVYRPCHDTPS